MKSKRKRVSRKSRIRLPNFWAAVTLISFPVTWIIAGWLGYGIFQSFAMGALAMIAILAANRVAEQELWFFDPKWRDRFEHPDVSFRLAVISGAILLIVESTLLVLFFTDRGMDLSILNVVFSRQCQNPAPVFEQLCDAFIYAR